MSEHRSNQTKESGTPPLVGSRRLNVAPWSRSGDRQICPWAYYEAPERTPHVFRHQLAGARLSMVDQTSRSMLLCNGLHEGNCVWPGGEGVGEIDEVRHAEIMAEVEVMGGGSPRSSASQSDEVPRIDPVPPRRR